MSLNLSKPTGIKLTIFSVEQLLEKMPKIETLNENIMLILVIQKKFVNFVKPILKYKKSTMEG